jgi:hypothetical protein
VRAERERGGLPQRRLLLERERADARPVAAVGGVHEGGEAEADGGREVDAVGGRVDERTRAVGESWRRRRRGGGAAARGGSDAPRGRGAAASERGGRDNAAGGGRPRGGELHRCRRRRARVAGRVAGRARPLLLGTST